jgi:2-polyprenyl-6-methoxyphenol hydroxylase-like FAD-dependent oxidoreductase
MYQLELERPMYEGRVVLIGDSAHAVLPTVGTGATLAMESAAVLAEELCMTDEKWPALQLALEHYQARRAPRIYHVRREANSLADVISWRNPLALMFRSWAMGQYPQNAFSNKMIQMVFDPI